MVFVNLQPHYSSGGTNALGHSRQKISSRDAPPIAVIFPTNKYTASVWYFSVAKGEFLGITVIDISCSINAHVVNPWNTYWIYDSDLEQIKNKKDEVRSLSQRSQHMVWCNVSSAAVTATFQHSSFTELYFCFTNSLTWSWTQNWGTHGYRSKGGWWSVSFPLYSCQTCRCSLQQPLFQLSPACLQPQTFTLNRVHCSSVIRPSEGCLGLFWCLTSSEF